MARSVPTTEPRRGLHFSEWMAEFAGTGVLMLGGLSAVMLDFGPGSPMAGLIPSISGRLLLTGLLFGGTGSLVAISPLGRRSGAHLNPAITLGFWLTRTLHPYDLLGYVAAQMLGAAAGTIVMQAAWGPTADALHDAITQPAPGMSDAPTMLLEAAMTALLVLTIFFFTSHRSTTRWTPVAVWLVVALLVWQGAPFTGASLNPARSFGPAIVSGHLAKLWIYFVGPLAGSILASGLAWAMGPRLLPITGKLFHDPNYPTIFRTALHLDPQPHEGLQRRRA